MAGEFFLGAAANAVGTLMVDYLVKPIERRICYLFRSGKIVEELHKQKNNLNREHIRVKNAVEEAKLQIQTQVIEAYVDEWLTNAETALKDVEGLDRRVDIENKKCCRWCPNLNWRYRLSKEMEKKTLNIVDLVQSSKFEQIGHRAELPNLEFMPSNDVVVSKSSTVAFNKIMDALKDEEVKMMGVWGMGGVGKTTLVTQVGNLVKRLQLFSKVIKVVVSQTQSIENILNKIADFLDLKFEKTTLEGKANELWLRLEKEEKVLIILDDMWNELNLKDIGIPLAEKGKGCKIILTTRNKRVCESMKCQVTVPVDVLGGEEAWDLFKMKANLDETKVSKDIIKEAKEVAEECKGLPVAIVTLASALKGTKTRKEWELARKQLERSRLIEIGDIGEKEEENAYFCIKMSYEYLKIETRKKCFLLCALYPEDHLIDIEDMVRYAWGLQLYGEADSVEECRIQVSQAVDYLKDSCLLLEEDEDRYAGRCIKLHDVVRDVALWIASKEENGFLIKSRLELVNVSSESCNAISLLNREEKRFPEGLMHSKLEIMLLKNCDIQGTCFQGMGELKVLSLSVGYGSPRVISLYALTSLQKLRTLNLEHFEDFSFLGNLRTLEILSLRGKRMKGFEDELVRLENLKILHLTECSCNSTFHPNVIRRMSKLEELYLTGFKFGYDEEINDFEFLKLVRYDISIRAKGGPYCSHFTEESWKIEGEIPLKVFSLLPENLESLDVSVNLGLTDFSCITQHARLESLVNLRIDDCPSLKSLFPLSVAQSLVLLETLEISSCHGLKQIVIELEGDEEEISSTISSRNSLCFPKLKKLEVKYCDGLQYIFPTLMAPQGLQGLSFTIRNCHQLKQVIKIPEDNRVENNLLLQQQLQSLRSLKEISISGCPQLTDSIVHLEAREACLEDVRLSAFEESFSTSKNLELVYCNDVECLADTTTKNGPTSAFTHLRRLSMEYMDGLESLCKGQPPQGFLEDLKVLVVDGCKKLQVLFQMEEHREENQDQPLSNLQSLKLKKLPELRWILKGSAHSFTLPSLKVVKIDGCSKLESLFSPSLIQSLVLLEKLRIESCPELKTLFGEPENDGEVESKTSSSHPLCLPKLKTLEIRQCSKLEYVVPVTLAQGLPALESVTVYHCDELKQVLGMAKEEDGVEHDLHLPSLQDVVLESLESLTSFIPDNYTVKAPALKTLRIIQCPKVMKVPIQQELNKKLKLTLLASGLSVFKELSSNTKDVILTEVNDDTKIMVPDVVDLEHLDGLTSLKIYNWDNCKCLVDTSQAMMGFEHYKGQPPMLKGFLTECQKPEGEENQAPPMILSNLEHLELTRLTELRWIVKGPTHCVNLQDLKLLQISGCHRLESLFSVSVVQTLRSLEELKIDHCDDLKDVFAELESDDAIESNTLCSLPNLKTVKIDSCPILEYVFPLSLARGLPRLQKVHLIHLRSLSSIGPGNNSLEAPALEILDIRDCPAFQRHVKICSTLKELNFFMRTRYGEDADSCNKVDTQLEQTSPNFECLTLGNFGQLLQLQGGYSISSLERMKLGNSSWLRNIWKGPIHVATNLRQLEVDDCNKLTYIFPMMLIPHLPQLRILKIYLCQNLKQIIANDDISASSSQCPQLEKKIIFPQLERILLTNLSKLESFGPVSYHLEFPCLKRLEVKKCFKMVTSFTVDYLTLIVHAQTDQTSQLDDVSPSQEVIFWERCRPTLLPQKKFHH